MTKVSLNAGPNMAIDQLGLSAQQREVVATCVKSYAAPLTWSDYPSYIATRVYNFLKAFALSSDWDCAVDVLGQQLVNFAQREANAQMKRVPANVRALRTSQLEGNLAEKLTTIVNAKIPKFLEQCILLEQPGLAKLPANGAALKKYCVQLNYLPGVKKTIQETIALARVGTFQGTMTASGKSTTSKGTVEFHVTVKA